MAYKKSLDRLGSISSPYTYTAKKPQDFVFFPAIRFLRSKVPIVQVRPNIPVISQVLGHRITSLKRNDGGWRMDGGRVDDSMGGWWVETTLGCVRKLVKDKDPWVIITIPIYPIQK